MTPIMSLLASINNILPATINGIIYAAIPNSPNINHLIACPTIPAILKLLNNKIIVHANANNKIISSLNALFCGCGCCDAVPVPFFVELFFDGVLLAFDVLAPVVLEVLLFDVLLLP